MNLSQERPYIREIKASKPIIDANIGAFYGLVCTVLLFVFLTLCIGVIYLLPVHDDEFDAFLAAACTGISPCFMAIEPGDTYAFDAIGMLGLHPWVERVAMSPALEDTGFGHVSWTWSGAQPAVINDQLIPTMWVERDIVQQVRIPLRVTYGRAWFSFAEGHRDSMVQLSMRSFRHILSSSDRRVELHTTLRCPFTPGTLWTTQTEIRYGASPPMLPEVFLVRWVRSHPCR